LSQIKTTNANNSTFVSDFVYHTGHSDSHLYTSCRAKADLVKIVPAAVKPKKPKFWLLARVELEAGKAYKLK
jgi:hypothetical protein